MAESVGISAPVTPAGGVDHRLPAGTPVTPVGSKQDGSSGPAHDSKPSTEFHLGTTVEAIVRAPAVPATAEALAVGTHLLLRIVALPLSPASDLLIGRVVNSGAVETLIDTPLGILAVQRRLTLAPETLIAFERLEEIAPMPATTDAPSRVGGWPALEEAIAVLTHISPDLAARLRDQLMPSTGPHLASALLFLWGALYQGEWPGAAVAAALTANDHAPLAQRLNNDAEELRRLENDPATGDWRVVGLPLFAGTIVLPLRLFMHRRKPDALPEELTRFAVEVELSGLGPIQLDGMLRGAHLVLVLRSHRGLPLELRHEASSVCRRALRDWGMTGDLNFAIAAQFALTPLANLRKHIQITI